MLKRTLSIFSRRSVSTRTKQRRLIEPHFDAKYYLSRYTEVAASGFDPIEHYLDVGWHQGYDPCSWFSTRTYLELYPDVVAANINPYVHYWMHGREEGRIVSTQKRKEASLDTRESDNRATSVNFTVRMPADLLEKHRQAIDDFFDPHFYRESYPDLSPIPLDQLIDHFNEFGWREWRDPCSWFSTTYYLTRYADIRDGGVNPFYHYVKHGRSEGRLPNNYYKHKRLNCDKPLVSVVIPNFNHGRYLEARIASIVNQTWQPYELIILDDASTDDSREVIKQLTEHLSFPVTLSFNETNSGNVFRQWEKGVSIANGDVIWICESDDFCDENFLDVLAPYFVDPSIMIAFGAIQFSNAAGEFLAGLDSYRESAAPGYWSSARVESARSWFSGPFGLRNVIANVGGCLFRRQNVEKGVWAEAQGYAVCGDWYLYITLARGGRIAFDPAAVSFFRQHQSNTSVSSFKRLSFYEEHFRIARELRRSFGASDAQSCRFYRIVHEHFSLHFPQNDQEKFRDLFNLNALLDQSREKKHILIVILGFFTGGGEIFPINLANGLVERGFSVSLMVLTSEEENREVRARLDSRIPIFERQLVDEIDFAKFIESHGIDLVHTHFVGADVELHRNIGEAGVPYVVTHHGSYESCDVEPETLRSILRTVNQWVFIADKNLEPLKPLGLERSKTTKLPNAVPQCHGAFPFSRESLGIETNAFVFGLASRALRSKGWEIAIRALELVRRESRMPLWLLICGEGPDFEELHSRYANSRGVKFLGYQREIMGFYELCDCCLLPTRFPGESYPLTIIEAILMRKPVISTDIGEIKTMLGTGSAVAGIAIPYVSDDDEFIQRVVVAMKQMLNPRKREKFLKGVEKMRKGYDFDDLIDRYVEVYEKAGMRSANGCCK
jgi:glycosyltransferase involved in cell wall biosynthesis